MEHRRLGRSGLKVSEVGIGCNNFGGRCDRRRRRRSSMRRSTQGITLFDTADVYGNQQSEVLLGQALGARRAAGDHRNEVRDADGHDGARSRRLAPLHHALRSRRACAGSAPTTSICIRCTRRIPTRRSTKRSARSTTLSAQGKVRYIGNSNFSGWQIADADWTARDEQRRAIRVRAESLQPARTRHRSRSARQLRALRSRHAAVFPARQRHADGQVPPQRTAAARHATRNGRSPRRTGAQRTQLHDRRKTRREFAAQREHGILDLAFGWLLTKPVISSVIAGATSAAQVEANVAAGVVAAQRRRYGRGGRDHETLMCGRVNVSSGPLTLLFMDMVGQPYPRISRDTAPDTDRYNVAPTEPLPVLRAAAQRCRIGADALVVDAVLVERAVDEIQHVQRKSRNARNEPRVQPNPSRGVAACCRSRDSTNGRRTANASCRTTSGRARTTVCCWPASGIAGATATKPSRVLRS